MAEPIDREYDILRELFDKAPLPYQSLDAEGHVLRINAAWLDLLGYTEDEVVGRHISEFLTPTSQSLLVERFSRFKSAGRVSRAAFELIRKDGRVVPIELNGTIATDEDGSFQRTHCIFMDVSERQEAERRLSESERRYRTLVELAHEGVWQIDQDAVTVYVNPAMAAMLGYEAPEMIGRTLYDFMDGHGVEVARHNLTRRAKGIAEGHDFEFVTKDGRRIYTAMATRPLHDEAGRYQGAIAGVIDMTEWRQLEQKMLQAHKLESLEVMAGGIAHDFNNLLQTILGNADLALMGGPYPGDLQTALEAVEKAAHQAAGLCRQMLAYAGRGVYAMEPLRLDELVLDLESLLKATISRKVDLRFELSTDLAPVTADPTQLRQVVVNLVTNAAESLQDGSGTVTVSVRSSRLDAEPTSRFLGADRMEPGDYAVLAVADSGCGIAPAVIDSIFDPFFSTKFTGRGLGLAVVRGVARGHGGGMTLSSAPGRGSCFEVWLPAAPAEARLQTAPAAEPKVALPPAAGRAVLVADDDEELRELVLRMFERLGWQAVGVADGAEAVAALAAAPDRFSLVLLDWSMPVMDGREALEIIRRSAPSMPVFMSSGHAADRAGGRGRAPAADRLPGQALPHGRTAPGAGGLGRHRRLNGNGSPTRLRPGPAARPPAARPAPGPGCRRRRPAPPTAW